MESIPTECLWDAFTDGARYMAGSVVTMACQDVGSIALPTGRIVACDPFTEIHTRHFRRRVEPNCYGVFLAVADYRHDERVAAAMILFAEELKPCHWEMAVEADAGPIPHTGYVVDSGRGCFIDYSLARRLYRQAERGRVDRYQRAIESQLIEHGRPTWGWANIEVGTEPKTNIVAFTTGAGDGSYPSFFGLDDAGRPVCLITDFGLLVAGI